MAHNLCCDSYHLNNMTYLLYHCNYIGVTYVKCAVSWGRCSLIGLLVFMSVVVVLVLLLFSFPFLYSLLLLSVLDRLCLV